MMNLPLFIPSQDLTNINEQLKLWIKMIRQEQLDLCGIKSDESTGKMLEIGIDENLDQAIKNTLDKELTKDITDDLTSFEIKLCIVPIILSIAIL